MNTEHNDRLSASFSLSRLFKIAICTYVLMYIHTMDCLMLFTRYTFSNVLKQTLFIIPQSTDNVKYIACIYSQRSSLFQYGLIHSCVKEWVMSNYGKEKWGEILWVWHFYASDKPPHFNSAVNFMVLTPFFNPNRHLVGWFRQICICNVSSSALSTKHAWTSA